MQWRHRKSSSPGGGSRRRRSGGVRLAIIATVASLAFLAGVIALSRWHPPPRVRINPPLTSIEVIERSLTERDIAELGRLGLDEDVRGVVPARVIRGSPYPLRNWQRKQEAFRAASGFSAEEAPLDAIWLLDDRGRVMTVIVIRPHGPELAAGGRFDKSRRRLAVWVLTETSCTIGEVPLSTRRFREIHTLPRGPDCNRLPDLFWRDGRIIVYCETAGGRFGPLNSVLEIDPETDAVRTILEEEQSVPDRYSIGAMSPSPDGRWLAFDRFVKPSQALLPSAHAGIWLLDLDSGDCREVTYELHPAYRHRLAGWESREAILFWRSRGSAVKTRDLIGHHYDLYRARISY